MGLCMPWGIEAGIGAMVGIGGAMLGNGGAMLGIGGVMVGIGGAMDGIGAMVGIGGGSILVGTDDGKVGIYCMDAGNDRDPNEDDCIE